MENELKLLLNNTSLPNLSNKLSFGKRGTGGRNNTGRITVRHRGGGHKRRILIVDYTGHVGLFADWRVINDFVYNPNTSSKRLVLCTTGYREKLFPYASVEGEKQQWKYEKIGEIRVGSQICNLELTKGKGSQLLRAAGVSGTIVKKEGDFVTVKLPSGTLINVGKQNHVLRGKVGNEEHRHRVLGKAGRNRWLGVRPRVRGEAMNPVDHPHGGKTSRSGGLGKPFKNIWGKLAKWSK